MSITNLASQFCTKAFATIGNTPMIVISMTTLRSPHTVMLKLEGENPGGSSKDRTAWFLVKDLEDKGLLTKSSTVVESTSGNLGVSLAMICSAKGYRFLAITDPRTTAENIERMKAMGAEVEVVEEPDLHGGYLHSRLSRVHELCSSSNRYVWTNQYENWANPRAHFLTTGPEIYRQAGAAPAVFVAVSTGGTLSGIARFFRQASPATRMIAVDARGSVIFGNPPGKRKLTGIGSGRPSDFISSSDYDQVLVVDDKDAFSFCREVYQRTGRMLGGSSGATLAACMRFFQMHPEVPSAVCVCPDRGENYASTIFNDAWMSEWAFETDGFGEYEVTIECLPNYIPV